MSSYDNGRPALAERMYESLREVYGQIEAQATARGLGVEALPVWHAHLPSGQTFRIRFIGVQGPFVSLIGHDADSRVLLAPEAVVIAFTQPPPEDNEPRVIGFAPPTEPTDE